MKKTSLLLLLLPLISSCGISPKEDMSAYQMSKEEYNAQVNRDYILTRANYSIVLFKNDSKFQDCFIDYGKMHSHFESSGNDFYGKFELIDDNHYRYTYYYQGTPYTETNTKEQLYQTIFIYFTVLFDIPFESFTFDSVNKKYVTKNAIEGVCDYAELTVKNKMPYNFYAIDGEEKVEITFSNHGVTKVTLPDENQ